MAEVNTNTPPPPDLDKLPKYSEALIKEFKILIEKLEAEGKINCKESRQYETQTLSDDFIHILERDKDGNFQETRRIPVLYKK